MGKLFWKFFFAFWLALLIAGLAVGSTIWLRHIVDDDDHNRIDQHQAALVASAVQVFELYGQTALIDYLTRSQYSPGPQVFAVNKKGDELLNRALDTSFIDYAREVYTAEPDTQIVRRIQFKDNQNFLLFVPDLRSANTHHDQSSLSIARFIFGDQRPVRPMNRPPPPPHNDEAVGSAPPIPPPSAQRHTSTKWSLFSLGIAGLISGVVFSFLLAWYFTRPIKVLREGLSAIAAGHLDTRVSPQLKKRSDELSELGVSFDEMAAKIQQLITTQQQLLHDVSHELRSPLARMQAAVGIAQQQSEKVPMTLERLEKDSQRMSDLIGELLLLSKMESGVDQYEFHKVSLTAMLEEIIYDASIEAETKVIKIKLAIRRDFILDVQPTLLHRAIENIVRNAIKYSNANTMVKINLEQETEMLVLKVKDQGPGLNESELEQVFKPFYRAGNRRENDSVGLGLAIATRAITSHGGHIAASNRVEGGLCVAIYLPKRLIVET